jgi:23S rRNA (adenine2503-C2)-methyltransferase
MIKKNIKNLTIDEAETLFSSLGEKSFRARQLFSWLYEKGVSSFDEMTNYSKELRSKLSEEFEITPLTVVERLVSKIDGTEKFLFETKDSHFIEAVLLRNEKTEDRTRITICVSSQVGCAMGCVFCNTSKIGFKRNLETAEIIDQLSHIRRLTQMHNNNVVFMGMGEPFNNYDNVLRAADIMNYSFGFHISTRRITISTCGILPVIERYIDEKRPYNLALSLNDADTGKRNVQMPVNKKYPIKEIADLLEQKDIASRNRITLEYVMRSDNISKKDAAEIKKLFPRARIKLNLIPVNAGSHDFSVPGKDDINNFLKYLEIMNVPVSIRKSLGIDINGACGQLSGKRYKNEDR